MSTKIIIDIEGTELSGTLGDGELASAIAGALPTSVRLSRWGDEYYGAIGLNAENESDAREVVDVGTLAYWPPGDAFCIFFGPTPASSGDEARAASAVTVIGSLDGDVSETLRAMGASVTAAIRLT